MANLDESMLPATRTPPARGFVSPTRVDGERLFAGFISCRTTLHELSLRASALGVQLSAGLIASYLTGKASVSDRADHAVVEAINARLGELSLPPAVSHRGRRLGTS